MGNEWTKGRMEQLIRDGVEESQTLEYKGAGSLGKSDDRKTEITMDVSAKVNAAGGVIITYTHQASGSGYSARIPGT